MIIYKTKYFTTLTHYTNIDGVKGIMRDGFINNILNGASSKGAVKKQIGGVSFWEESTDHIRNNKDADLYRMMENWNRRLNRNKKLPIPVDYPMLHGKSCPGYSSVADFRNDVTDGIVTRNRLGEITFPKEYKQLSAIAGLSRTVRNDSYKDRSVYRVVVDTKNGAKINTNPDGYNSELPFATAIGEVRVEPEDLDRLSQKIEIPRGLFKTNKKTYIKDYKGSVENKYEDGLSKYEFNTEDEPTKEVIDYMKKLFKSRGKR